MKNFCARSCSLTLLLGLAAAFLSGAPDWQGDYTRGVEKFKAGAYAEAARLIGRAAAEKPASCDRCLRDGMFFDDYYPNFYLGTAYLMQGQYRQALTCFEALNREGKVQRNGKLSGQFQANYATAREKAAAAAPPPTTPPVATPPPTTSKPPVTAAPPTTTPPVATPYQPPPVATPYQPPPVSTPPPSASTGQIQYIPPTPNVTPVVRPASGIPPMVEAFKREVANFEASASPYSGTDTLRIAVVGAAYASLRQGIATLRARADQLRNESELPAARDELNRQRQLLQAFSQNYERARALKMKLDALNRAFAELPEQEAQRKPALLKEYLSLRTRVQDFQRKSQAFRDWNALQGAETGAAELQAEIAKIAERFGAAGRKAAASLNSGVRDAREIVRQGFAAYFAAKFDQAANYVREAETAKATHPYLFLLKGLLDYTRYQAEGAKEPGLADRARAEFKKAAGGGIRPENLSTRFFSPKVVKFFQESM